MIPSVRLKPMAKSTRSAGDRKSTRRNSSHPSISYAVFCLKKKTHEKATRTETDNAFANMRMSTQPRAAPVFAVDMVERFETEESQPACALAQDTLKAYGVA